MMEDLIKALKIFLRYTKHEHPTQCFDDELFVDVLPDNVTDEDKVTLKILGFEESNARDGFISFRFGSC